MRPEEMAEKVRNCPCGWDEHEKLAQAIEAREIPYRSGMEAPRVVPYIVIRPAADLPDGFLPDDWNGRWIAPPPFDASVRTNVFGAQAIATDRYEQREDGVWAQVYEVRPPVPDDH